METSLTNVSNELPCNTDDSALARLGQSDYIPYLSIAYATSEAVERGIARPGEFVLSKTTSLGSEIAVVPLAYRLHVVLVNTESFEFVESEYTQMGEKSSEAYMALVNLKPVPPNHEVQEGADLFLYIPKVDAFAQIFLKKTLARAVQPIWSSGKGGRLVILRTEQQKNKLGTRKWYNIVVAATSRALSDSKLEGVTKDVEMNSELYLKYLNQFRNPPKKAAETVKDESTVEIER